MPLDKRKPLAIDLFCGLGGWTDGLLAEGWNVIGFDIERHRYQVECKQCGGTGNYGASALEGDFLDCDCYEDCDTFGKVWEQYPGQLVLQDILTLHGSQFRNADLIVASPPCEEYSRWQMPWTRARNPPQPNTDLFWACFRIQREACEAAGRYIPKPLP
jgi:site-specific DNA-cytosine methylase